MAVELGYISGCHGIKGWLKVFSYCEPREQIFSYPVWLVGKTNSKVLEHKINGKRLIARLSDIQTRNQAEQLVGIPIIVDALPRLQSGEHYWQDLIGLTVVNLQSKTLGVIREMLSTKANDIIVVESENSRYLIPYTYGMHVQYIDLVNQKMTVDWIGF